MNESRPPNQPPNSDPRDENVDDGTEASPTSTQNKRRPPAAADSEPSAPGHRGDEGGADRDEEEQTPRDGTPTEPGGEDTTAAEAGSPRTAEERGDQDSDRQDPDTQDPDTQDPGAQNSGTESQGPVPTRGGAGTTGGEGEGDSRERGPLRVVAVIALIALIAAGVLAATAWHLHERLETVETELAALPAETERRVNDAVERVDVRADLDELATRLAQESDARSALADRVDERSEELAAAIADVRELAVGHHTRWRLAEVRYLVNIGVRRLQLAEDPDGAASAFEAADEALHRLGDARLLELRAMLVEDIARIRALEPADVEGIALRLRGLEQTVGRLPVATAERPTLEPLDPDAPIWEQIVERLRGLVVVRHRDAEPIARLGDELDGLTAHDGLALALRQARLAALNGDSARYERALSSARDVLAEHFDGEARVVGEFNERLERLAEQPVRIALPDLGPTLDKVAEVTARLEAERERAREAADGGEE